MRSLACSVGRKPSYLGLNAQNSSQIKMLEVIVKHIWLLFRLSRLQSLALLWWLLLLLRTLQFSGSLGSLATFQDHSAVLGHSTIVLRWQRCLRGLPGLLGYRRWEHVSNGSVVQCFRIFCTWLATSCPYWPFPTIQWKATVLSNQIWIVGSGRSFRAFFTLMTRLVAMWALTNPKLGTVSVLLANIAFDGSHGLSASIFLAYDWVNHCFYAVSWRVPQIHATKWDDFKISLTCLGQKHGILPNSLHRDIKNHPNLVSSVIGSFSYPTLGLVSVLILAYSPLSSTRWTGRNAFVSLSFTLTPLKCKYFSISAR